MDEEQKHKTECFAEYADRSRLNGMSIFVVICIYAATNFVLEAVAVSGIWNKLLWAAMAIAGLLAFSTIFFLSYRAYLAKAIFSDNGIECTLLGRQLKKMCWSDIKDIVRVTYVRHGKGVSWTDYLVFSGHELSDDEKKKSIELAGLRNDIIVVKYSTSLVKQIKKIHDFTFENESKTKKN